MHFNIGNINRVLGIATVVLALLLVVQAIAGQTRARERVGYAATWRFNPGTLAETNKLASQVVLGKVIEVRRGPDLITQVKGEPGDQDRIPTEIVTLQVEDTLKGPKTDKVEVFHTGLSVDEEYMKRKPPAKPTEPKPKDAVPNVEKLPPPTPEQANRYKIHGDPAYKQGERYVLFLADGPALVKGIKRPVAPQGRYLVTAENKLKPATELGYALKLKDKPLDTLVRDVKTLQKPPAKLNPVGTPKPATGTSP